MTPLRLRLLALCAGLALAGCTVGPSFHAPAGPPDGGYIGVGEATAPSATAPGADFAAEPRLRWWEAFGSAQLDQLVDRAIAANASLQATDATLARARQQVAAVAGRQYPQLDGNARVEREEANLAAFGFDPSSIPGFPSNPVFNLYTVGGGVTYDADLFGANRRRLEQARAQAEAQRRQAEAAHLTLAGRVVNQALTIAAIRSRIAAFQTILSEDQRLVDLTEARRKGGEGTLVEVLNVRSQLDDDRGDLPQLYQQLDEARHMLATLVGVGPAELGATDFQLSTFALPRDVPVAIPSRLVRKRPDILQAEANLHADTAAIGVATADLYPDITLGATLSFASPTLGKLFSNEFQSYDVFGALTAPIFHGGTLKAEQRAAIYAAKADAATYKETVLEAFQQVADLLQALNNDQRSVETQAGAVDVAARNRDLSRKSFQVGNSGIVNVLDAERLSQRAQLALVEARARQYQNIARLYVATAGGWTGPAVETAAAAPSPARR